MKIKEYCIFAKESIVKMGGNRGKMTTQGGHAYLHCFFDAMDRFPDLAKAYRDTDHAYKITLIVPTVADLEQLHEAYKDICGVSLVKDAGFTVFKEPTVTALGILISEDLIGDDLRALKVFM